jgi:carbohydrate diacid regulator
VAIAQRQFVRTAVTIADRAAELLAAEVVVMDSHGQVVASSGTTSKRGAAGVNAREDAHLQLPLRLGGHEASVIIKPKQPDEPISPRLARILIDLVIDQTTVVDRLPNKQELKSKFIHDLLHGTVDDEASIFREAQILGMDLAPPRLVILIDATEYILGSASGIQDQTDMRVRQRAQLVISSVVDFFELPNDTICAYIGGGDVAVLKASNRKNLGRWAGKGDDREHSNPSWANLEAVKEASRALLQHLRNVTRSSVSIGIGRHHPRLDGLSSSYADARAALSLGRHFHGYNRVHCLDSLGIAAFIGLSDEQTKIDLATYLLSPLDREPELFETVNAFFAQNCLPSATARELSIHRNTLSYRLDKIVSLTGLDPRRFDDAVQIRLALLLRSFQTVSAVVQPPNSL